MINLPILLSGPKSVNCTICHCSLDNHKNEINLLCNTIIDSCVSAGKNCIPLTGYNLKRKFEAYSSPIPLRYTPL